MVNSSGELQCFGADQGVSPTAGFGQGEFDRLFGAGSFAQINEDFSKEEKAAFEKSQKQAEDAAKAIEQSKLFETQQWMKFGQAIFQGVFNNDWRGLGSLIAEPIANAIAQSAGGGVFGGLLGGFIGAGINALFEGFGGGGGRSERRGDSINRPVFTSDVNTQALLTQMLNATKLNLAMTAARAGQITAQQNQLAVQFESELAAIGENP